MIGMFMTFIERLYAAPYVAQQLGRSGDAFPPSVSLSLPCFRHPKPSTLYLFLWQAFSKLTFIPILCPFLLIVT